MTHKLRQSALLGREIRSGDPAELGLPTEDLVRDALAAGDRAGAIRWLDYRLGEVARVRAIYEIWISAMLELGRERVAGFDRHVERLAVVIGTRPPSDDTGSVGEPEARAVRSALHAGDTQAFEQRLERLRESQLAVHDAQTDWCWGLLTVFRDELGEEALDEVFRVTQAPWLADRYGRLAEMTAAESLELTVEGMRGHFTGPARRGAVSVEERVDGWVLSFDPCGSGGRMRRGDPDRDQSPRTEVPYSFGVTEEAHDWSWGRKGVCLYCAHCAVVNEILPIETIGAPMRVVEYPERPDEQCRWTIFKSPELVPDDAFRRVGKERPR
jgi:hypothetical protein